MATGQGTTWVLVAHAHGARILEVDDAGLMPRIRTTLHARADGTAAEETGRPAEAAAHGAKPGHEHPGWTNRDFKPGEAEERRFTGELVRVLERGLADGRFQHLVLVAPPHLLGHLRDGLTRGLADRLRASSHKDWAHLSDSELVEHARPLVDIWPRS